MVDILFRFIVITIALLSSCRWCFKSAAVLLILPAHFLRLPFLLVGCGYLLERGGLFFLARNHYTLALHRMRTSPLMRDVRWTQATEFLLERSRARVGKRRVHDPLFDTYFQPQTGAVNRILATGFFEIDCFFAGLKVIGFTGRNAVGPISIYVNNDRIKTINTLENRISSFFSFTILRNTLSMFPRHSTISIRTGSGDSLLTTSFSRGIVIDQPHATGSLSRI